VSDEPQDELKAVIDRITVKIASNPLLAEPTPEELDALHRQHRSKRWLDQGRAMGIPARLIDASFTAGRETEVLNRARVYAQEEYEHGKCLVLMGPTGVGKTYAAIAAMRAIRDSSRFWYFPALCGALLDQDRRAETLQAVKETPFVVLDDFGAEYLKVGGLLDAFIDEIIWHRESEEQSMILTTNLLPDQLRERLSDRIVDRLNSQWGALFVVPGESLRERA